MGGDDPDGVDTVKARRLTPAQVLATRADIKRGRVPQPSTLRPQIREILERTRKARAELDARLEP